MSFFRKWKLQNKHKKLSEEWTLAASIKNISSSDFELNESNNDMNVTTFDLKYLGSTTIDSEKSEKSTSEAIKSVLSLTKTKGKKNPHVKVNVSSQGIDVINNDTYETILKVSIYKISYCSADGLHPNVFAFVGSSDIANEIINDNKNDENLQCHVFQCAKRKIAQEITLAVARCFQNAYDVWCEDINTKITSNNLDIKLLNNKLNKKNNKNIKIENGNEFENPALQIDLLNNDNSIENELNVKLTDGITKNDEEIRDLLIDLSDAFDINSKQYLQTTWVSFDDDNNQMNDFNTSVMVY